MIHASVGGESSDSEMVAAIILYGPKRRIHDSVDFATVHPIDTIKGVPHILPGRPISDDDLATIHKGLSTAHVTQGITWLDQHLLAKGLDRMIWWTPPGKRPMFFKESSNVKGTFNGSAVCPVPALVWMAIKGRGLYVFATNEPGRPTQATELYQAPFFNVWGKGLICAGNANLPSAETMWDTGAWESFFFSSHFTHPNFPEKDRLIKGKTAVNFWKEIVAKPPETFPVNRLVRVPFTAQDLIDPLIVDRLNKLPRPKGEF